MKYKNEDVFIKLKIFYDSSTFNGQTPWFLTILYSSGISVLSI